MFKSIILSLLLLQTMNSQCGKGCLRCTVKSATDSTKVCQLCDIVSSYYMKDDGTCTLSDLKNCLQNKHDNTCGFCNPGFYIDQGKCVAIDVQKKIVNCEYYDNSQNCSQCLKNYFISNNSGTISCTKIDSPKANCMVHTSATVCTVCDLNYYFAEDNTCKAYPTDCLSYSHTQCNSCASGYIMNMNQYRKNITKLDTNTLKDSWWMTLRQIKDNIRSHRALALCEPITALNCATYESFEQCATCFEGYYLDSGTKKCTLYPEPIIKNCQVYEFLSANKWQYKCYQCNNLFRKQDDKTCVAINITDCIENNATLTTDTCTRCKSGKKLASNNCTTDQLVIDGCSVYVADADKCLTCVSGKILNTDGTACKTPIANCLIHQSFTTSTETLTCSTCNNGYIKNTDGSTCTKGTMNCDIYTSATSCSRCSNQYHAATTCLTKHADIADCEIYSRNANNTCLQCSAMKVPFLMTQKCKNFTALTGCLTHKDIVQGENGSITVQCDTCAESYIKNQNNLCDPISGETGFISGCVKLEAGECIKCESGKYLTDDSTLTGNKQVCKGLPDWSTANCSSQVSSLLWSPLYCEECNSGYYPLSLNICLSRNEMQFLSSINPTTKNNLDKCAQIDSSLNCDRCKDEFYQTDTDCVSVCTNSIQYVLFGTGNVNDTTITNNVCKTASTLLTNSQPDTSLFGYNNAGDVIQYACKNTFYTVRNKDGTGTNLNPWKTDLTNTQPVVYSIADQNQGVNCPAYQSGVRVNTTEITTAPTNLPAGKDRTIWTTKIVTIDVDGTPTPKTAYLTIACGWQKGGTITGTGDEIYINCDASNSSNFTSTRFGGVPLHWQNLFNVHQCVDNGGSVKIPVIAFVDDANNAYNFINYQKFGLDKATVSDLTGAEKHIFCLDIKDVSTIKTQMNLESNNTNVNAMLNCGMGFLNLRSYTDRTAFNNIGYGEATGTVNRNQREHLTCVACKPGFKPDSTKTATSEKVVRGCTAIPNCSTTATQTIFNSCSECEANYTWGVDSNGNIQYDTCVQIPTQMSNCLAYQLETSHPNHQGQCKVCKKGYFLDLDGNCILPTVPNCTEFQAWDGNYKVAVKNYLYDKGADCKLCSSTHIVWGGTKRSVCLRIPTLADSADKNLGEFVIKPTQVRGSTNYIDRCQRYYNDETCVQCHTNYILTLNKLLCKPKINDSTNGWKLANCAIANNDDQIKTCNTCDLGYSLVSSGCEKGNITQCQTYQTSSVSPSVTCTKCNNGYWLKSTGGQTTCEKGKIQFCNEYNSENNCMTCQPEYWLLNTDGSSNGKYCFPKDTGSACKVAQFTSNSDSTPGSSYNYLSATCKVCDGQYSYKVEERTPKCTAISYPPSNSCKTVTTAYDLNLTGSFSFQCTECNTGFYLSEADNNYVCIARNAEKNVNCEVFEINQDKCTKCKSNYYLNANRDGCIAYPTGKYACIAYDNALKCTACDVDHYLSSDACIKVETKVDNCVYYSADNKCSACKANFFLTTDVLCEAVTTSLNCATYESKDSCKTCAVNSKLVPNNGKNSCQAVTVTSNCTVFNVATEKCTQCAQYYYVNDQGTCTSVAEDLITGCLVMASSTTCQKCVKGRALSSDKKVCRNDSDLDLNCQDGLIASTPVCSLCKAGYQFQNGKCAKNTNATIENGCYDELSDKTCLLCIPGWSMLELNKCSNNNPPVVEPKNSIIYSINLLILAMIYFQ